MDVNITTGGNYLYDKDGHKIGVKKDSKYYSEMRAKEISGEKDVFGDKKIIEVPKEDRKYSWETDTWILFDENYNLENIKLVEELDLDLMITMFLNGDLPVEDFVTSLKNKEEVKSESVVQECLYQAAAGGTDDLVVSFSYTNESGNEKRITLKHCVRAYDETKFANVTQEQIDGLKSKGVSDFEIERNFEVVAEELNGNKTYRLRTTSQYENYQDFADNCVISKLTHTEYETPDVDFMDSKYDGYPSKTYGQVHIPVDTDALLFERNRIEFETYEKIKPLLTAEQISQIENDKEIWGNVDGTVLSWGWHDYLTQENKIYMNQHPDEFDILWMEDGSYGYNPARELELALQDNSLTDELSLLNDPEAWYASMLNKFAHQCIKHYDYNNFTDLGDEFDYPAFYVQFNENDKTVTFTDHTVKIIKEFLQRQKDLDELNNGVNNRTDVTFNYMSMLGLTVYDSEDDIKEKIKTFISTYDSSADPESMTMDFSKYYNKMTEIDSQSNYLSYTSVKNILNSIPEALNKLNNIWKSGKGVCITERGSSIGIGLDSLDIDIYGNITGDNWQSDGFEDIGGKGLMGGDRITPPLNSNTNNNADNKNSKEKTSDNESEKKAAYFSLNDIPTVTESDISKKKNELVNAFKNELASGYGYISKEKLDKDGNIVFGDEFYKDMAAILNNWIHNVKQYDGYTDLGTIKRDLWNLFDLKINEKGANAIKQSIQSYLDNDCAKLKDAIQKFINKHDKDNDGKLSVEEYYDAIANDYGRKDTYFGGFYTEEGLKKMVSTSDYIQKAISTWKDEGYDDYIYPITDLMQMKEANGRIHVDIQGNIVSFSTRDFYNNDKRASNEVLTKAIHNASNIQEGDSLNTQYQKINNFVKQFINKDDNTVDGLSFISYLLGNNTKNKNYINEAVSDYTSNNDNNWSWDINDYSDKIVLSGSSNVTEVSNEYKELATSCNLQSSLSLEFDQMLIDNGLGKYMAFKTSNGNEYTSFSGYNNDYDSLDFQKWQFKWNDESTKDIINDIFEKTLNEFSQKYPGKVKTAVFDGTMMYISLTDGSFFLARGGRPETSIRVNPDSNFEPTVDKPISYSPIKVYNNKPANLPEINDGSTLYKTPWEGIYVTESDVYIWNANNNEYLKVETHCDKRIELINGELQTLISLAGFNTIEANWFNPDSRGASVTGQTVLTSIVMSLVYGYNRTDEDYIFEKDGKLYMIDEYSRGIANTYGINSLEYMQLRLIEMDGQITYNDKVSSEQDSKNNDEEKQTDTDTTIVTEAIIDDIIIDGSTNTSLNIESTDKTEHTTFTQDSAIKPEVYLSNENYLKEASDNFPILQKNVKNVIKNGNTYYNFNTYYNKQFNYVWEPYEKKWQMYEPSELQNNKTYNDINNTRLNIIMTLAAIKQGLSFTSNPNICIDNDGNYYYFDEKIRQFIKQD